MGRKVDPVDQAVGRLIKKRRLELGFSQDQIAKSIGVTFQQVQKYERGTNRISAGKLYILAQLLKTNVGYFFTTARREMSEYPGASEAIGHFAEGQSPYGIDDEFQEQMKELKELFAKIDNKSLRQTILDLCRNLAIEYEI